MMIRTGADPRPARLLLPEEQLAEWQARRRALAPLIEIEQSRFG